MYKGGKILFTASLWISPTQGQALGSGNFMFHRRVLRSPGRKLRLCKKNTKPQIPIQSVPGGLYGLSAPVCLTAAVKQELAPAKYWQKTFPGIHLYCQSSAQRFPFPLPGEARERWGIQPGRSGELAHKVPALQTEIIFFSNISIKSVMWGLSFFFFFAIAFYIKNRPLNDVTVLVSRGC